MDKALQTMINNMPEKTGKSLDQWKSLLKTQSFEKHMEAVNFLKNDHNVSHGFANTIISLSKEDPQKSEDLVATQYKGKEALLTIYDRLLQVTTRFGQDVTVTPKKTSVSIIRKKQFALIRPATKTRIDLGLKLKDVPITKRLENSGPFGSMCTHRVRLESTDAIDDELIQWLQDAYDQAN
jgi:hypothetical protein